MDPGGLGVVLGGLALALSVLAGAGTVVALTRGLPAQLRRVAREAADTSLHLESAFESQRAAVSATLESIEHERDALRRERKRLVSLKGPPEETKNGPPDPKLDPHAYAMWLHHERGGGLMGGL
ncbi:MAG: hypothetical protein V3T08_10215 [Gemmatimonadota bacterium]